MKLTIRTPVNAPLNTVWEGFNEELFEKLSPPFPPVKLIRFDGSRTGDIVSLELNFLLFKQNWTSLITNQQENDREIFFVDEGRELPFFLTYWRHKHRLTRMHSGGTLITDKIEYRTPFLLTDYLIYPFLWAQFAYRGPIYKRFFAQNAH